MHLGRALVFRDILASRFGRSRSSCLARSHLNFACRAGVSSLLLRARRGCHSQKRALMRAKLGIGAVQLLTRSLMGMLGARLSGVFASNRLPLVNHGTHGGLCGL